VGSIPEDMSLELPTASSSISFSEESSLSASTPTMSTVSEDVSIHDIPTDIDLEEREPLEEEDWNESVSTPTTGMTPSVLPSERSVSDLAMIMISLFISNLSREQQVSPSPSEPLPESTPSSFLRIPTPSGSASVSVSTPQTGAPSLHTILETIPSEVGEQPISRDIERLMEHLDELDRVRSDEARDLASDVREIRDELYALSDYLRTREVDRVTVSIRDTPRQSMHVIHEVAETRTSSHFSPVVPETILRHPIAPHDVPLPPTPAPATTGAPTPAQVPTYMPTPAQAPTHMPTPAQVPTHVSTPVQVSTHVPTPAQVPVQIPTPIHVSAEVQTPTDTLATAQVQYSPPITAAPAPSTPAQQAPPPMGVMLPPTVPTIATSSRPTSARPHLIPIPLTPPPFRDTIPSPSSFVSSVPSFLSSHHSDDDLLDEEYEYEHYDEMPPSPPYSASLSATSTPSSPDSSPTSVSTELPQTEISMSEETSGTYLSRTSSSQEHQPSPAMSETTDHTARPSPLPVTPPDAAPAVVVPVAADLSELKGIMDRLREEFVHLWESQQDSNRMLDDLRHRPPVTFDMSELSSKLDHIEDMLRNLPPPTVIQQPIAVPSGPVGLGSVIAPAPAPAPPAPESEAPLTDYESSETSSLARAREFQRLMPNLTAPQPVRADRSLDQLLADLLRQGPEGPPTPQPLPPFVPLNWQPSTRVGPHHSGSPAIPTDLPPLRPFTVEPVNFEPRPGPRVVRRIREPGAPSTAAGPTPARTEAGLPGRRWVPPPGQRPTNEVDFDREVRRRRADGDSQGFYDGTYPVRLATRSSLIVADAFSSMVGAFIFGPTRA
jgi:hypothetical protein